MTPLPSLPPNLDPNCVNCGVISSLTSQLNPNNFGQLVVGQLQPGIGGGVAQVTALAAQVSTANAATRALIEAAIPDTLIDQIIQQYTPINGVADIKCVTDELNSVYTDLNQKYNTVINLNQLPPLSATGLLETLVPPIPVPEIPSPAEIKEYILEVIDKKKKAQQEAIKRAQLIRAGEIENV